MNERLIWRPNNISPEDWEKLTREEQIGWWKEQQPKPSPHPLYMVKKYHEGLIDVHFPGYVWPLLTEQNIGIFLEGCPKECLLMLQRDSDRLPKDDDIQGWQGLISIRGGCYAPWVTQEEIQQAEEAQYRAFREGLRLLREASKGTHPVTTNRDDEP